MANKNGTHVHRLAEICHLVTDGKHGDCTPHDDSGYFFLSCKDVRDGQLCYEGARQITEEDFNDTHKRTQLAPSDILITNSGTIGRIAFAKDNALLRKTTFQKSVAIVKPDAEKVMPRWLYYYLIAETPRLVNVAGGTAQKNLLLRDMRAFEVDIPPLPTQRRIASILSAYDDLIENNTRRITILEEMARRIYEEWFVRFRFPGHEKVRMVESELGLVPEGWEAETLADCALITMGQSPSSEHYNTDGSGLPFHQGVTDFGAHYPSHRMFCSVEGRMAREADILMSVRAPVGRINLAPTDMVIGRGLCAIRSRNGRQWFLLHRLLETFREEDSMGNGAIFKAVTKQEVYGLKFSKPPVAIETAFEKQVAPMWRLLRNLTLKNANLRTTRDLLLPKLISGELDVSHLPEPEAMAA